MRIFERGPQRWEVEQRDTQVLARRFEAGALVEDAPTDHGSTLRAKWEADRLCGRLVADGWVRLAGEVATLGEAELEDALRASPDDLDTYLVYADWLSDRGDDRGQLITVQHALATLPRFADRARRDELTRAETMLLFQLAARLWGVLGETIVNEATQTYACDLIEATWSCGFVRAARIRDVGDAALMAKLITALAALPTTIVLRALDLADHDWEPGTLEALAAATWPVLEQLALTGGRIAPNRITPLFDSGRAPRLARVDLTNVADLDAICESLASGPIAARLETLALRDGAFTPRSIGILAGAKFPRLRELVLVGTGLGSAAIPLQAVAPTVRIVPVPWDRD